MCQQFVNISFNSSTIPSWPTSSFLSLSGKGYKIDLKSLQRGKRRLKRWTWSRFQTPGINQWPGPSLANKISQDPGFWEVDVVLSLLQNMLETPAPSSVAADPALIPCHSHHSSTGGLLPGRCHLSPRAPGERVGSWKGRRLLTGAANAEVSFESPKPKQCYWDFSGVRFHPPNYSTFLPMKTLCFWVLV